MQHVRGLILFIHKTAAWGMLGNQGTTHQLKLARQGPTQQREFSSRLLSLGIHHVKRHLRRLLSHTSTAIMA